jgi:hypothetical protein
MSVYSLVNTPPSVANVHTVYPMTSATNSSSSAFEVLRNSHGLASAIRPVQLARRGESRSSGSARNHSANAPFFSFGSYIGHVKLAVQTAAPVQSSGSQLVGTSISHPIPEVGVLCHIDWWQGRAGAVHVRDSRGQWLTLQVEYQRSEDG